MAELLTEEQRILSRSEARALISSHHRECQRVVRVTDDDAILFLGRAGRPWTAWLSHHEDGAIGVRYEEGWPAVENGSARVSSEFIVPPFTD